MQSYVSERDNTKVKLRTCQAAHSAVSDG